MPSSFNGQPYSARVLKHNLFDLQLSADDAMDGMSQLSLTLANADSTLSELNAAIGFKGAQLTVYFAFADLQSLTITTESTVLFRGVAGDPDEIAEDSLKLSFTNRLSLQRIPVPEVRIQRSCPWNFPSTAEQGLRQRVEEPGAVIRAFTDAAIRQMCWEAWAILNATGQSIHFVRSFAWPMPGSEACLTADLAGNAHQAVCRIRVCSVGHHGSHVGG